MYTDMTMYILIHKSNIYFLRAHPSQGFLVEAQVADRVAFRWKIPAVIPEVYPQAAAVGHQQDDGAASLHFRSGASNLVCVCARLSKIPLVLKIKIKRLVQKIQVLKIKIKRLVRWYKRYRNQDTDRS